MRLFVSVDLSADLADAVADVQAEFSDASGLNFVDPTQAHVTLKFLGDVPDGQVETVEAALERAVSEVDVAPFDATFAGLGAFPSTDYISVVWLGVEDGSHELTRLHESVEQHVVDLGFDPEDHEFTPHVTLARMKHAGGKDLVQELLAEWHPTVGTMRVDEVRLTKSELGHEGPEYSTVHSVPLD